VAQWQGIHLPMQETQVQSLSWDEPLKKEMATNSSILAWKIQWTEEPGELQSMGLQEGQIQLSDLTTTMRKTIFILMEVTNSSVLIVVFWWDDKVFKSLIFPSVISFRIMQSDLLGKKKKNCIREQYNFAAALWQRVKGDIPFLIQGQFHRLAFFFIHLSLCWSLFLCWFSSWKFCSWNRGGRVWNFWFPFHGFFYIALNLHWFEQHDWSF